MAVKIRLSRIGKKKAPFYRVVAIDSRKKRDGQYIEDLGTYNPLTGELIQFHQERINNWISKGAIPTQSVIKLQKMYVKHQKGDATT
jgi:small subunit ribosomal protein S16